MEALGSSHHRVFNELLQQSEYYIGEVDEQSWLFTTVSYGYPRFVNPIGGGRDKLGHDIYVAILDNIGG